MINFTLFTDGPTVEPDAEGPVARPRAHLAPRVFVTDGIIMREPETAEVRTYLLGYIRPHESIVMNRNGFTGLANRLEWFLWENGNERTLWLDLFLSREVMPPPPPRNTVGFQAANPFRPRTRREQAGAVRPTAIQEDNRVWIDTPPSFWGSRIYQSSNSPRVTHPTPVTPTIQQVDERVSIGQQEFQRARREAFEQARRNLRAEPRPSNFNIE